MYVRKQVNQLPSKMRFVAAQFNALLRRRPVDPPGRARQRDEHSACTRSTSQIPSVVHGDAPAVNSVFPSLPPEVIEPLQEWCFFWDWDVSRSQVRWMTAWDTTIDDVEQFAAGVRHLLGLNPRSRRLSTNSLQSTIDSSSTPT